MTIESVGPGGVNCSSGPRTTTAVSSSQTSFPEAGDQTNPVATFSLDSNGDVAGLVGPDGASVLVGPLQNNVWMRIPSIFRLRLTGTGTCTLDARDSLGAITLAFATYTASAATDQIEFPFAGTSAVEIRATLTGTCTAEVI